eukprot:c14918_g1_i1.p1 GENE.c14918_g1_i1~~c14918_g1_i1.p1  ORF type:complete len:300 (+),score=85.88 c14918_g1_i1:56-955(+)
MTTPTPAKWGPPTTSSFKPDILAGKVALVTGGATGIGFGICRQLGLHGCKIAILARRENVIEESVKQLKALGIDAFGVRGDVRDPALCVTGVQQVVSHFGQLDILVNNAAGNFAVSAEDLTPGGLNTVIGIDFQGCFNMCKAALEPLKKSSAPIIINITATLQYKAQPFQLHAAGAKAAIDVLTRTLGVEWADYGIRCVGIAPGPIEGTEGGPSGRVFGMGFQLSPDNIKHIVPAGRFGSVDDIGMTAVFLCSPAAAYITAENIVVDGGQWHGASGMWQAGKRVVAAKSQKERQTRAKL